MNEMERASGTKPFDMPYSGSACPSQDTAAVHAGASGAEMAVATGAKADVSRPVEVEGPMGEVLTLASLPPPDTRRWVVRRKAEVLAAINGGLMTAAEACARYRLSPEELELWQDSLDRAGVPGLRVTRIQLYRDYGPSPAGKRPAAPVSGFNQALAE
jgi:hypothetical protein